MRAVKNTIRTWRISGVPAMWQVARDLGEYFQVAGGVLALHGDLGMGKTTLVQGLAASLGVTQSVTSPTYALVIEYPLPDGRCLVHMDLYRLQGPDDLDAIGFDEYVESEAVIAVEWAERAGDRLPDTTLHLTIQLAEPSPDGRLVQLAQRHD